MRSKMLSASNQLKNFYQKLKLELPDSNAAERKILAAIIIEENLNIEYLSSLLFEAQKVASRFAWLLSDVAEVNPKYLSQYLPFLFTISDKPTTINFKNAFPSYWWRCGIPIEQEAEAIDFLFEILTSNHANVSIKTRALFTLKNVIAKHPEVSIELKSVLEDQLEKNTKDFKKRAEKILKQLNKHSAL